jgi:hypothetical protein
MPEMRGVKELLEFSVFAAGRKNSATKKHRNQKKEGKFYRSQPITERKDKVKTGIFPFCFRVIK